MVETTAPNTPADVKGGDRLTLLRDADGNGAYEFRSVFATDRSAPYGLVIVNNGIYVANQDAVVHFNYSEDQTVASGPPATNQLWEVANERDEIGPYLVPVSLTSVKDSGLYG